MFGLKIFVRVQTFWRVPPVLPCNFCHSALTAVKCRFTQHDWTKLLCFLDHCFSGKFPLLGCWMNEESFHPFFPRIKIKKNRRMRVSFQNHWSHFSASKLVFSREDNMGRIKSLMTRLPTKKSEKAVLVKKNYKEIWRRQSWLDEIDSKSDKMVLV